MPSDPTTSAPPVAQRDAAYTTPRPDIFELVPSTARDVLDVGCSNGALGRSLKRALPGRQVSGIEFDASFAKEASEHLDRVVHADVNVLDWRATMGESRFDCIVFADVLEHLIDPQRCLAHARQQLRPGGCIVISLPNIRHLSSIGTIFIGGRFSDPGAEFTERSNRNVSQGVFVTGSPYAELLLACIVWAATVPVERTVVERIGRLDTTLCKGQEYDLRLRPPREVTMLGMDIPPVFYRAHDGGITSSIRSVNYEYLILSRAVERWGETGPDSRAAPPRPASEQLARSSMNHGVAHSRRGDAEIAVQSLTLAIRHFGINLRLAGLSLAAVGKRCWSALRTPAGQVKILMLMPSISFPRGSS